MKLPLLFTRSILSLDIGAYEIKAIEGRERSKDIKIYKYFTMSTPIGAYDNGKIIDKYLIHYALSEGLKNNDIKAKDVYLTINNPYIVTRKVVIPKVDEKDIKDILSFQLEDYIPTTPGEYVVQFRIIEEFTYDDLEKLSILLIAIPKGMVEEHFELLKDLDLNPIVLDYQPNSMAKLIQYNDFINEKYSTHNFSFAIIDIGYDNTKISIIENGKIYVTRVIENGGKHIEQNISKLNISKNGFETLNRKIDLIFRYFLSRSTDNKIDMIILMGGIINMDGIEDFFSDTFDIPSIKINSLDKIALDDGIYKYMNAIGTIIRG